MNDKNPFSNEYNLDINITTVKKEEHRADEKKTAIQDNIVNEISLQYRSQKPSRKIIKAKIV